LALSCELRRGFFIAKSGGVFLVCETEYEEWPGLRQGRKRRLRVPAGTRGSPRQGGVLRIRLCLSGHVEKEQALAHSGGRAVLYS